MVSEVDSDSPGRGHLTLTESLFTQVYLMVGVTLRWTSIPSRGGVAIFQVA